MKLLYKNLDLEIVLTENKVAVCFIEKQEVFSEFLLKLLHHINGDEEGDFLLSEKAVSYDINKVCEIIFNPLSLDCNNKKVLTSLYKELSEYSEEFYVEKMAEINSKIIDYLDLLQDKSSYQLSFGLNLQPKDLFKLYDVLLNTDSSNSILEQIMEYLKITNELCGRNIFVFVNLKSYLGENEIKELYKFSFYSKVFLVLVESHFCPLYEEEEGWIIDKDLCIIKT